MVDEGLIERLRIWNDNEAADRIEQLNADVDIALTIADKAADLMLQMDDRRLEAEAKLAKAVAALRYVVSAKGLTDPTEYGYDAIKRARAVLAELEGK
jgi:hypothetical protein